MPYVPVPNTGQTLGGTRDQIRDNIQALKDSLAANHVDLDSGGNTGKHGNVVFFQKTPKLATAANEVEIFNKADGAGLPQLWMQPQNQAADTNSKQLTAGDITSSTFGTLVQDFTPQAGGGSVGTKFSGGWSFLAGALLFQYGSFIDTKINNTDFEVKFPRTYTDATTIIIMLTPISKSGGTSEAHLPYILPGTTTTTEFKCRWDTSTTAYIGFTWTAIGR